jgi:integrase
MLMRDRAILLLLARFGLRAGDIVHLRLSDIDWKGAWIHVCGKGRSHTRLLLTQEVGEAIVTYLKKGRPRTNTDTLFVRCHAPFCTFSSSAVSHIVAKAFRRADVARPVEVPPHLLRHSLATFMFKARRIARGYLRCEGIRHSRLHTGRMRRGGPSD